MLHVKLNGNEEENTMQANILPFYTPTNPRLAQKVKSFFLEVDHAAYKIKGNTCRTLFKCDLLYTPDIYGWVKWSDMKIVQISLFELVVTDYGLSDTQDGLRCSRNGIYILWLIFSPYEKNSGERFRAHGPSC